MAKGTAEIGDARDLDALLAGYAGGSLSAPLHALVSGHLAMNRSARRFVAALEAAGSAELEALAPTPVNDRDGKLAAIFGLEPITLPARGETRPCRTMLPEPLRRYLGREPAEADWRVLMPGVRQFQVERAGDCEAAFYWLEAGRAVPQHRHAGIEITLVLDGAFADGGTVYGPGEVALADEAVEHSPVADGRRGCLCFTVTEGPVRLTGPVGLLHQLLRP
ncbi:MAG TPA: ChrR family anti-sigma-E factor [Beijerinckiaceae bacterium]